MYDRLYVYLINRILHDLNNRVQLVSLSESLDDIPKDLSSYSDMTKLFSNVINNQIGYDEKKDLSEMNMIIYKYNELGMQIQILTQFDKEIQHILLAFYLYFKTISLSVQNEQKRIVVREKIIELYNHTITKQLSITTVYEQYAQYLCDQYNFTIKCIFI